MTEVPYVVTFWGVRGSLPVPGEKTLEFGGNTACVQIEVGDRLCIMDAGTGIFNLGKMLAKKQGPISGDIFITHTHWDHIQGFPFFGPAFVQGNHFTLYGQRRAGLSFAELMRGQMAFEYFPVSMEQLGAEIEFREIDGDITLALDNGISLKTLQNNHPGGGLSFRIDHQGRSCCYVSDFEHSEPSDQALLRFVQNCDLLIYDAHFTDQEYAGEPGYSSKSGWGHSTWQEGIKLTRKAGVKELILFHHANFHTDEDMKQIEQEAQEIFANCRAAREGMVITL
jgi:phosphoribosyl 1,2-cyclic phosphodiesterase